MTAERARRVLALGLVVFYGVGVFGHLYAPLVPGMVLLTPWFLWGSGLVVLLGEGFFQPRYRQALGWVGTCLVLTYGLEVLGVATGWVFGPYHYDTVLGVPWAGVPPVIGWNWVLVVLGIHVAVGRFLPQTPEWVRVAAVGLACIAFDVLLEPVAVRLHYWAWDSPSIPLQNFLAWGGIGAVCSWWAGRFPRFPMNLLAAGNVALQAVFFAILGASGVRT